MGDIVYLRIIGEKQGDISSGCGTYASVGNRWQVGHEDEIFAFALTNAITSTGKGCFLYTSDAADDLHCVDLRGRRLIIKKLCL